MPESLVRPLFDGPLDIVGDVHGEIDALVSLLSHLRYDNEGTHPENRRLVFLGDLTDRGPDSPAVVDLVQHLVSAERAQCVLGNHDLNILLGDRKHDNHWFFGELWSLDKSDEPTPAALADDAVRQRVLEFFETLPLVLERDDVRVVHACWDDAMVELARDADDVVALYREQVARIDTLLRNSTLDDIDRGLQHQNLNPVKVLTSGKEQRVSTPYEASGKVRHEERVSWWSDYPATSPQCVIGHYAKLRGVGSLAANVLCADFGVAKRWQERKSPTFTGTYRGSLGAIRLPERIAIFDQGEIQELQQPRHR